MSEVSTQTLHVVARELNNELNDARASLELFGEQQDQVELLSKCRNHLRQVRGALRLVEVFGAALLVEEMEQLSQYLIDHIAEQRHLTEGLDALMRAMVQLPTYLERVMGGGRDMALILLPLLNDLRAVRGQALLSEGTLLLLNLSSDQQANPLPASHGEPVMPVANWARRMRTRFQLGLLGWIKGERVDQNLEILARAAEKLEQVATTQHVFQLWWVTGAVIEALRDGGLEGTASVKRLLGQADRQMKRLYEVGEQAYANAPSLDLLNNLLYYVARSTSEGLRVSAVRASFRLHDLLPIDAQVQQARESLSAPSIKLMRTVAAAIKEDLAHVKDALDIYVRKPGAQIAELAQQLEMLKKIGDTLGVLGLGELREKAQQQVAHLQEFVQTQAQPDEASLLSIAAVLIGIEDSLDEQLLGLIAPGGSADDDADDKAHVAPEKDTEYRQVSEAVLRECIVNLARIKEAIALAMEKSGEAQALEQIPALMRGIIAGLLMLGKARAVEVAERINQALMKYARPGALTQVPERMDRLADAMVAVEYYMETLQAGRNDPWYMLDNAETCLRALDAMVTGATSMVPNLSATSVVSTPVERTMVIDAQRDQVMHAEGENTQLLGSTGHSVTVAALPPTALDDHATTHLNLPPVLALPPDKEDPEFLELFIEEARDELAKLQQLLPRWDDNPQDQDALTNVRRSFHTLKGSGRLVGAQLIGEFAWSMENLLNRIISKTLDRTPQMLAVLKDAVAALPELVEQLESGRVPQLPIGSLIAHAHALAGVRDVSAAKSDTGTQPALPDIRHAFGKESDTILTETIAVSTARTTATKVANQASASAAAPSMDNTLNEIFAKEVAGHLVQIREYIDKSRTNLAPYTVTEALHRACHTLNGASKTANAKHNIRITEPLNHYIRKLYDNNLALPAAGLSVLKDAMTAIEYVVSNPGEDTLFFASQNALISRIAQMEDQADAELAQRNAPAADQTGVQVAFRPSGRSAMTQSTSQDAFRLGSSDPLEQSISFSMSMPLSGSTTLSVDDINELRQQLESGKRKPATLEPVATEDEWFEITTDDLRRMMDDNDAPTLISRALRQDDHEDSQAISVDDVVALDTPPMVEAEPDTIIETAPWAANFEAPVLGESMVVTELAAQQNAEPLMELSAEQPTIQVPQLISEPVVDHVDEQVPDAGGVADIEQSSEVLLSHEADADSEDRAGHELADQHIVLMADSEVGISVEEMPPGATSAHALQTQTELPAPEVIEPDIKWSAIESTMQSPVLPDAQAELSSAALPQAPAAQAEAQPEAPEVASLDDDYDPDVAAIFTEEAAELLEVADTSLQNWRADRNDTQHVYSLKRALHTLKGGARMAGIRAMGDLSHELESFMERVEHGAVQGTPAVFSLLQTCLDELSRMRDVICQGRPVQPAQALIARIQAVSRGADDPGAASAQPAPVVSVPVSDHANVISLQTPLRHIELPATEESVRIELDSGELHDVASDDVTELDFNAIDLTTSTGTVATIHFDEPSDLLHDALHDSSDEGASLNFELPDAQQTPELILPRPVATNDPVLLHVINNEAASEHELTDHDDAHAARVAALPPGRTHAAPERGEVARVDAELLDNLLNNAGEVSILRSRLEQQVSSLEFNLSELGRTVTRLKDQFRKLEIETEAQILHKHHDDSTVREDFDPLELDRYSSIQQLSRALAESVSDVDSIEGLLETMTREAQNLLLQQARVVTELQNGLMKTRMVPFSRHAQRLTRLVRQTASEVGKQVELSISGATGELDRQVLERMLPPFEHMLRNSVVHGIETPAQRKQAGKSEAGSINVSLQREGAEMVITLQDDGKGIDLNAVREKARAKGLISGDRVLTDEEAMQLILEPGFSTASAITQHAGRGVGMDVVVNEIKKLGGTLFTESKAGQGVKFTIRLPFTLAISQSLLVRIGDSELYALPLATIEGVVRLPRAEVEAHLASTQSSFNYGGQSYKVQHLGALIDGPLSVLPDNDVSLVLIKAGEHSTALVTDELLGNREIVVKTVGPQVSSIRGIAGATILGDGRVVIILDMGALVRSEWRARHSEPMQRGEDRRTLVLVVDDSITVRRVTQRLLERHGMRVLTAKDGVDALETLQEHLPDVILLDIEMPRMDGYELASRVRGEARTADIPIIMITSRVSDKHKARAIELGVNDYLGKPYQENQLLDAIEAMLQAQRRRLN